MVLGIRKKTLRLRPSPNPMTLREGSGKKLKANPMTPREGSGKKLKAKSDDAKGRIRWGAWIKGESDDAKGRIRWEWERPLVSGWWRRAQWSKVDLDWVLRLLIGFDVTFKAYSEEIFYQKESIPTKPHSRTVLKRSFLFSGLEADEVEVVIGAMEEVRLQRNLR
jgi:hypothetical protein